MIRWRVQVILSQGPPNLSVETVMLGAAFCLCASAKSTRQCPWPGRRQYNRWDPAFCLHEWYQFGKLSKLRTWAAEFQGPYYV